MGESMEDKLDRVKAMASPRGTKWDLSPHDRDALSALLILADHRRQDIGALEARLRVAEDALRVAEAGLLTVVEVSRDREAFVMLGPRAYQRAETAAKSALAAIRAVLPAEKARLDADRDAEPKTRLVSRVDVERAGSHCITPGPATAIEDTITGERMALHEPADKGEP